MAASFVTELSEEAPRSSRSGAPSVSDSQFCYEGRLPREGEHFSARLLAIVSREPRPVRFARGSQGVL